MMHAKSTSHRSARNGFSFDIARRVIDADTVEDLKIYWVRRGISEFLGITNLTVYAYSQILICLATVGVSIATDNPVGSPLAKCTIAWRLMLFGQLFTHVMWFSFLCVTCAARSYSQRESPHALRILRINLNSER